MNNQGSSDCAPLRLVGVPILPRLPAQVLRTGHEASRSEHQGVQSKEEDAMKLVLSNE